MRLRHVRPLGSALFAGRVLRYRALGSESVYRVIDASDSTVGLEVISAPGLEPGRGVRLSIEALHAAEPVRRRRGAKPPVSTPTPTTA